MPCPTLLETDLAQESGRIGCEFVNTYIPMSPWLTLSVDNQEVFPEGMGDELTIQIPKRSFATTPTWVDLVTDPSGTASDASTCAPDATVIKHAYEQRQYKLQQIAIESEMFCLENLRSPWKAMQQISHIVKNLQDAVKLYWIFRYQEEAFRAATKVVVNDDLNFYEQDAWPTADEATGRLNQEVLDYIYEQLNFNGGGVHSYGMDQGSPVYSLITSGRTSRGILRDDPAVREDIRYAKPDELLKPLGVDRSYAGFFHLNDALVMRADYDTGTDTYIPRSPFAAKGAVTKGVEWAQNPDWRDADYEVSFVYTKGGHKNLIPQRPSVPAGMEFEKYDYVGTFKWLNIPDRDCNPDGNMGNWRARLAHGTKMQDRTLLYALIHKRCNKDLNLAGCVTP